MPASRWRRLCVALLILAGYGLLLLILLGLAGFLYLRSPERRGRFMQALISWQYKAFPNPIPPEATPLALTAAPKTAQAITANQLFQSTQIWSIHLRFTSNQWVAMAPQKVRPYQEGFSDQGIELRNPYGGRPGVLGVLGFELPWSEATEVVFADLHFSRVAARHKGNGTFLEAIGRFKRSFKLVLDKNVSHQRLAGRTTLNLHNLTADSSYLRETLAYEYFQAAGIPAPRTAFADVLLTIDELFDHRRLGLYELVENPDDEWAQAYFGEQGVALFKPVTRSLFSYLGDDWQAYQPIYAPKTKVAADQKMRVIEFARLVSLADEKVFSMRVSQFLDLDELARFLASEVLLSNYDGILANGQNFLLYLDPRTHRFGFIPWDLDHSWGEFGLVGTRQEREQATIWRPWVGENRFLERVMSMAAFKERYRAELERQLRGQFIPERLANRMDELAALIRPVIAAESPERLHHFNESIKMGRFDLSSSPSNAPGYLFKDFVKVRAHSVRQQLDGKSPGLTPTRQPLFQ